MVRVGNNCDAHCKSNQLRDEFAQDDARIEWRADDLDTRPPTGVKEAAQFADLDSDASTGERSEQSHIPGGDCAAGGADIQIDFFGLVLNLAGIAAGEQREQPERVAA